jgi:hypothetical protein
MFFTYTNAMSMLLKTWPKHFSSISRAKQEGTPLLVEEEEEYTTVAASSPPHLVAWTATIVNHD